MSNTTKLILTTLLLGTALATPAAAAPHNPGQSLPHYVLFDVGSFGGGYSSFCYPNCRQLNRKGEAVGVNTTSVPDPLDPLCFIDCHVDPAFLWRNGGTNALGSLKKGRYAAWSQGINDKGESVGIAENGAIDEDIGIFEGRAVLWKGDGKAQNLGTFGGTQSNAWMINNSGQVVADAATSDTNDPYLNAPQANCKWLPTVGPDCGDLDFATNTLFFPLTTTVHAAGGTKAGLADIGTLGGPDSSAIDINEAGQIVGWSYTSYKAGTAGVPDTQAFVWDAGSGMQPLPGLGGTFSAASQINSSGQISGVANTSGDAEVHAVVWNADHTINDKGTLGSDYAHPDWMNEAGDIVGFSRTSDQLGRAFVYWHDGAQMIDLGIIGDDPESEATGINNKGMIVGGDFVRGGADLVGWVSNRGGPITDLNTLVRKSHGIHINTANTINDRGVIAAQGDLKNGEHHAVILVPENDFDMLARMKAAMRNAPRQENANRNVQVSRPSCRGNRRMRPHFCTGS